MPATRAAAARLLLLAATALPALLPAALPAQALDTARVRAGLRDLDAACRLDSAHTWGRSLCGPLALVDRESRLAIGNRAPARGAHLPLGDGLAAAVLPPDVGIANTSFDWHGEAWAMVVLPLPADRFARTALLVHESWHREQPALGLAGPDRQSAHLDERDGRYWLRLELRALAAAVEALAPRGDSAARDAAVRRHAGDALLFRARRHALVPGADTLEAALEITEGLAEYTGVRLALALTGESPARAAQVVRGGERRASYVRSFAYATGPGLGLLLDRLRPAWRGEVRASRTLAPLLAASLGWRPPRDLARAADARARHYDGAELAAEEDARHRARAERLAAYRARFLEQPVLVLRQQGVNRSFDPNALVPFGALGTVYPTGTFMAPWGRLHVTEGGALLAADFSELRVAAPAAAAPAPDRTIAGPGWTLTLADGWTLRAVAGRTGSFEVVPTGG